VKGSRMIEEWSNSSSVLLASYLSYAMSIFTFITELQVFTISREPIGMPANKLIIDEEATKTAS
jgi:hypothetical protein